MVFEFDVYGLPSFDSSFTSERDTVDAITLLDVEQTATRMRNGRAQNPAHLVPVVNQSHDTVRPVYQRCPHVTSDCASPTIIETLDDDSHEYIDITRSMIVSEMATGKTSGILLQLYEQYLRPYMFNSNEGILGLPALRLMQPEMIEFDARAPLVLLAMLEFAVYTAWYAELCPAELSTLVMRENRLDHTQCLFIDVHCLEQSSEAGVKRPFVLNQHIVTSIIDKVNRIIDEMNYLVPEDQILLLPLKTVLVLQPRSWWPVSHDGEKVEHRLESQIRLVWPSVVTDAIQMVRVLEPTLSELQQVLGVHRIDIADVHDEFVYGSGMHHGSRDALLVKYAYHEGKLTDDLTGLFGGLIWPNVLPEPFRHIIIHPNPRESIVAQTWEELHPACTWSTPSSFHMACVFLCSINPHGRPILQADPTWPISRVTVTDGVTDSATMETLVKLINGLSPIRARCKQRAMDIGNHIYQVSGGRVEGLALWSAWIRRHRADADLITDEKLSAEWTSFGCADRSALSSIAYLSVRDRARARNTCGDVESTNAGCIDAVDSHVNRLWDLVDVDNPKRGKDLANHLSAASNQVGGAHRTRAPGSVDALYESIVRRLGYEPNENSIAKMLHPYLRRRVAVCKGVFVFVPHMHRYQADHEMNMVKRQALLIIEQLQKQFIQEIEAVQGSYSGVAAAVAPT